MNKKEVIEILKELPERIAAVIMPSDRFFDYKGALDFAIKALEADKWISVKEKLPEEYGNYLVFTDDGDIDIGTYQPRYIVGTWSMCDANGFYWADDKDLNVIAWKPLPKPYESEA